MNITLTRNVAINGVHHQAGLEIEINDLDGSRIVGMGKATTDVKSSGGARSTKTAGELKKATKAAA